MNFFSLRENSPYSEVFWPVLSGIRPEYGEYSVNIQSECGKKRTRKAPNTDTFHVAFLLTSSF